MTTNYFKFLRWAKRGFQRIDFQDLIQRGYSGAKILEISRRRKDIMELLRWSKKIGGREQVDEIRRRGRDEVIMLRRMMERAARTGDLSGIVEYQVAKHNPVTEESLVSEAVNQLNNTLKQLIV